jgi:hypothetical protein
VPATAEIVIEGHIAFNDDVMEGLMNEYPDHNAFEASLKPVLCVSAITYRDGAILPVIAARKPVYPAAATESDAVGAGAPPDAAGRGFDPTSAPRSAWMAHASIPTMTNRTPVHSIAFKINKQVISSSVSRMLVAVVAEKRRQAVAARGRRRRSRGSAIVSRSLGRSCADCCACRASRSRSLMCCWATR